MAYHKVFEIRWSDLDPNRHLANARYTDLATHTRFSFLNELGFGQKEFAKYQFGPVIFGEQIQYFKEIHFGEKLSIDFEMVNCSAQGFFYEFRHGFYKENGDEAARLVLYGSWMNLLSRKLERPHQDLFELFERVPKAPEFEMKNLSYFKSKMAKPNQKIFV